MDVAQKRGGVFVSHRVQQRSSEVVRDVPIKAEHRKEEFVSPIEQSWDDAAKMDVPMDPLREKCILRMLQTRNDTVKRGAKLKRCSFEGYTNIDLLKEEFVSRMAQKWRWSRALDK